MTYLILTVGTGTAGRHSNLAEGLRKTLQLAQPDKYWLVPSTDEISQLTADFVREGIPGFQAWSDDQPYLAIDFPDSLERCRKTVRQVILRARQTLSTKDRLLVNPTSGTKQMSVGAALAALDEGVGEMIFTTGQRADGVVITGTEKLESFNASLYFAERDKNTCLHLAKAGAFAAASTIARRHESLSELAATAQCLHEWERQNYTEAFLIATKSESLKDYRQPLQELSQAAKNPAPQLLIISDMIHTAELLQRRRDFESSLVLACRALEMGLRRALFEITGLHERYLLAPICKLPINPGTKERCRNISNDGKYTILNLHTIASILVDLQHDMGFTFQRESHLRDLIITRNTLMHQIRAVTEAESQRAVQRVKNFLSALSLPLPIRRPSF